MEEHKEVNRIDLIKDDALDNINIKGIKGSYQLVGILFIVYAIIGIIFGYTLLIFVLSINKVEVLYFIYKINFASYFLSFMIIVITLFVIMTFTYKKLQNINMIESLKSVE